MDTHSSDILIETEFKTTQILQKSFSQLKIFHSHFGLCIIWREYMNIYKFISFRSILFEILKYMRYLWAILLYGASQVLSHPHLKSYQIPLNTTFTLSCFSSFLIFSASTFIIKLLSWGLQKLVIFRDSSSQTKNNKGKK